MVLVDYYIDEILTKINEDCPNQNFQDEGPSVQSLDSIEWDDWMTPTYEGELFEEDLFFTTNIDCQENVPQTRS
jgi:hypothetical protein